MCTKGITLKAACADSFYYPEGWDPSKGTLDKYQQQRGFEHYFGKTRTKNLDKGVLQIRFEMPFKVQCLRCSTHIGQGTRYDADKKKVGKYFTTTIFEFAFRCCVSVDREQSADGNIFCNQRFVIRTDPKNRDYELAEGLRKAVNTWDPKDTETMELPDPEEKRQMQIDPMFKLEKTTRDKKRERSEKERLMDLYDIKAELEDDYDLNCAMRSSLRKLRKEEKAQELEDAKPRNFALTLLPPDPADALEASSASFRTDHAKVDRAARRAAIKAAPLLRIIGPAKTGGIRQASKALTNGHGSKQKNLQAVGDLAARRQRIEQHARMARLFAI